LADVAFVASFLASASVSALSSGSTANKSFFSSSFLAGGASGAAAPSSFEAAAVADLSVSDCCFCGSFLLD